MPVKSEQQRKFMGAIASGSIKRPGLSQAKAQEFLDATPKGAKLPKRISAKKKSKSPMK